MLSFNVFTLFLILAIWSLQQIVLNYTLIVISPWLGLVTVFDFFLVIHITTNTNLNFAAMKGGVQWMVYVWSVLVKAVLLLELGTGLGRMIGIAFMLTPVLYAVWTLRASAELYGFSIKILSMESLFHTELAFGVVLDLLDIFSTFDPFSLPPDFDAKTMPWIFSFRFVVVLVALAMHSYSFPTSTESSAPSRRPADPLVEAMQSDVIFTSKHSALVSILVLDIPLLVIRTLIWVDYPAQPGFSIFTIKNIVSLPFSVVRLHRCRMVEKERPRTTQAMYFPVDFMGEDLGPIHETPNETENVSVKNTAKSMGETDMGVEGFKAGQGYSSLRHRTVHDRRRKSSEATGRRESALAPLAEYSNSDMRFELEPSSELDQEDPGADNDTSSDEAPAPTPLLDDIPKSKLSKFLSDLRSVRRIPVSGFGFLKCTTKLWHCIRAGSRLGMAGLLDETFTLSYWKQLRLCFPLLITCALQITLVATYRYSPTGKPTGPSDWATWDAIPDDYKVSFYSISVCTFVIFLLTVGTAPFLDVVFVSILWFSRNISFYSTFAVFRDSKIFDIFSNVAVSDKLELACKFLFIVPSCIYILKALFPVQSAFLGRRYMYFAIPPASRALKKALLDVSSTNFTVSQLEQDKVTRSDECGWISTSSILVFHNCRHWLAPVSYHELIVGPNLVKSLRAIDFLVTSDWLRILMLVLLKFATCIVYFDLWNLPIFISHILLKCIYCLFAQAVRLLSLRRYEVKYLFEEIVQSWNSPDANKAAQPKRFLSLADILQHYQHHGFFTSPGSLFPPFI